MLSFIDLPMINSLFTLKRDFLARKLAYSLF